MLYPIAQMLDALLATQEKGACAQQWQSYQPGTYPQVNLYEEDDHLVLTAELAGYKKADLSLEVKEDRFTLKGEQVQKETEEGEERKYFHRERARTKFTRNVTLPYRVDASQVKATFEDGLLSVQLPRNEADKAQEITLS